MAAAFRNDLTETVTLWPCFVIVTLFAFAVPELSPNVPSHLSVLMSTLCPTLSFSHLECVVWAVATGNDIWIVRN